jgi:hypothetical protein
MGGLVRGGLVIDVFIGFYYTQNLQLFFVQVGIELLQVGCEAM